MKYLVTGGAGFIGSHLVEALLQEGHWVTVFDDLSTGSLKNLAQCMNHERMDFVEGSVISQDHVDLLPKDTERIFHLAATVGVDLVLSHPIRTIETNVHGTENILRYASKVKAKILITSTSEVYGKASQGIFSESDDLLIGPPTHSRWAYAASKLLDEFFAMAYCKDARLDACIVRLFNTVGPRQSGQYGMVVPRFVRAALSG
ncbi:MAG: GDP-mannose 4,6-dehydratase, partial [Verrucomicrobia bacterium]|nr:GDP-mannose 4,6-dehydratase [Verrucomicrobiota bacterium]